LTGFLGIEIYRLKVSRCFNVLTPLRRPDQHLSSMSRGLGHLERTILAMVERRRRKRQRVNFTASDIEYEAYPGTPQIHAQHVAVLRAMHSFVRKHPQYALIGGKGSQPLVLVPLWRARQWAAWGF
jgi:hypothetical protein